MSQNQGGGLLGLLGSAGQMFAGQSQSSAVQNLQAQQAQAQQAAPGISTTVSSSTSPYGTLSSQYGLWPSSGNVAYPQPAPKLVPQVKLSIPEVAELHKAARRYPKLRKVLGRLFAAVEVDFEAAEPVGDAAAEETP